MFCISCGNKLEDGVKFCPICGMPVKEAFENPSSQEQPAANAVGAQEEPVTAPPTENPAAFPMPATSLGTSDAMQTLKNAYATAKRKYKEQNYTPWQTAAIVCSLVSVLCFLCSFTSNWNWVAFLAAAFLAFLCFNKEKYDTVLAAVTLSVFMGKGLILWLVRTAPYLRYIGGLSRFVGIVSFLLELAFVVLFWLVVTGTIKERKIPTICNLIFTGLLSACSLLTILLNIGGTGFTAIMSQLGNAAFIATYFILILSAEKDAALKQGAAYNRPVAVSMQGRVPGKQNMGNMIFCSKCGNALPADSLFCDDCGTPVEKTASVTKAAGQNTPDTSVEQEAPATTPVAPATAPVVGQDEATEPENTSHPQTESDDPASAATDVPDEPQKHLCEHCGKELEAGSLFCDFCGAAVGGSEQNRPTGPAQEVPVTPSKNTPPVEGFMGYSEYVIDEKVSVFKFANAYKVYDSLGNVIGGIQQVNISGGAKAARLLMGSNMKAAQGFQFNILDNNGDVLTSIKRGGLGGGIAAMRTITILDGHRSTIGCLKLIPGWTSQIKVTDAAENELCTIKGDWKGWNFIITSLAGTQIGEINKKWSGVGREFFTNADRYRVALQSSFNEKQKIIVTTAAIAIDMIMHEF